MSTEGIAIIVHAPGIIPTVVILILRPRHVPKRSTAVLMASIVIRTHVRITAHAILTVRRGHKAPRCAIIVLVPGHVLHEGELGITLVRSVIIIVPTV